MLESAFGKKKLSDTGASPRQSRKNKKDKEYLSSLPGVDMDALEKYYEDQKKQKLNKSILGFAKDNLISSNAVAPLVNTIGSAGKIIESVGKWAQGEPLSNDSTPSALIAGVNSIKSESKDKINESTPEKYSGAANVAYDVGSGVLDFGTALLLAKGNPAIASGLMTSNAAGNSLYDAVERNVSPGQAMATGATSAVAEYLMNLLPLGTFDDALKGGSKNAVKNIAKQGAAEAIEEGGTEAINAATDVLINKEKSNFSIAKQHYMRNGMTEEEATKQALTDTAKNIGYSALVGGLSGSAIGGGTSLYNGMVGNANNASELDPLGVTQATTQEPTSLIQPLEIDNPINVTPTQENVPNSQNKTSENGNWRDMASYFKEYDFTVSDKVAELAVKEVITDVDNGLTAKELQNKSYDAFDAYSQIIANKPIDEAYTPAEELLLRTYYNQYSMYDKVAKNRDFVNEYKTIFEQANVPNTESEPKTESVTNQPLNDTGKSIIDNANSKANNTTHTPEQLKVMGEYQNASEQEIIDFANKARDKSVQYVHPIILTEMNDSVADYVMEQTGIDTHGNNIILNRDSIRHIDSEHINNKNGKSIITDEDLARIKWVLDNADEAVMSNQVSNATRTKEGKPAPHLFVRKRIDGHYYIVEAVSDGKKKNNIVISAFIEEAGNEYGDVAKIFKEPYRVSNASGNPDPSTNVQDAHEISSSNLSVPNSVENVNSTSGNQRVRSYNTTLIEKTDAPQELKNEFIENPDMYTQLSNAETLTKAVNILESNDINTAINEYHKLLDDKNPVAVPLGYNISKQLAREGRLDESVQIVREMSKALTESGQFSQAAAITMLNNNPEAAKRYLVRDIDNLNREGKEKFGKKWKDFELTEEELQSFNEISEGDSEAIKAVYNDVYNRLRKEYPSTITEQLMEYRRVAMLLNVRTNVRNVVSNAFMLPVRWTADRVAALGEGVYSLIDPKYSRTQSLNPMRSKQSKQLASEAFETVRSELLGDNKYEDRKGAVRDKQVFKGTAFSRMFDNMFGGALTNANQAMGKDVAPSLMETARNFTYFLLQKGDDVFVKKNFESRMASYLEAQGITSLDDIPADAYMLATQEALKATFKDDTKLSKGLTHIRQMLNSAPGGILGDIVMPFTKTPANLAMRGIDYSPAGLYNGIKTWRNAKSEADVSKAITQIAQSATGTMAIALGMALAEAGLISGALSEDKDEAQFQRQQGMLPYAIKTPYGYFSYDWAQPASIPLILGVTIHDSFVNGKDFINGIKQGSLAAVDSWLELSPLQNMSEIFGGYGTPAENVAEVLMNDFPLSFVPSQLNAIAKTSDRTQRVSYSPDSKDSFINQAKAKIPGMSEDLPVAYDTWGNPIERQDNVGEAIFANMLNPGQFGNENATQIDDDIMVLYDATGNASVFPKKAAWSYKVGGENIKLDNKQYSEFQRIMGSNAFDMADALINSNYYNSLSDEQKVKIISGMYSFADALAKTEILGYDVEDSDTYKKSYAVYKEKGVDGVALFTSIKTVADGETSNAAHINAVNQFDVSDEEKGYYITKLKGKLSQEAQEVFQTEGYAGVYQHYYQKALESKVEEMRQQPQGSVTVTQDMIDAVAAMRNQSTTTVTPEMIEAVKKMRSGM